MTARTAAPTGRSRTWHFTEDGHGLGAFMLPPGHPALTYVVHTDPFDSHRNHMGLLHAASPDSLVPPHVRRKAQRMIAAAFADGAAHASELWLRHVYGYYATMYRGAEEGKFIQDPVCLLADEGHAAVVYIRTLFPDHQPRRDLIEHGRDKSMRLYGSYPCVHCDGRVQYDACRDALVDLDDHDHGRGAVCDGSDTGHSWE